MIPKEDLLAEMVKLTVQVDIGFNPNVYSVPFLAKDLGQTQYAIRKAMKELETDGLVERSHYGDLSEWDWQVWCIHGWSITEKVRNSDKYRKCEEKALEDFEKEWREFDQEWDEEHPEGHGDCQRANESNILPLKTSTHFTERGEVKVK